MTPMEIQIDQNRINLIDQEIFRLEREIAEQKVISDDCDAVRARFSSRIGDVNSAYSYSQKMEKLLECADKKKSALEMELRLNRRMRELREERAQLVARVKSYSATTGVQLVQSSQATEKLSTKLSIVCVMLQATSISMTSRQVQQSVGSHSAVEELPVQTIRQAAA